jgi:hypothetical protein
MVAAGCQKTEEVPPNPFDAYKNPNTKNDVAPPDSASLVGLHTYIFSRSCAQPACHDGSFEPDFRTVQSTYSTLVYQPVVKNNAERSFRYRVVPGEVEKSWLYERVVTDDAVLGRMPLYDQPLNESQLRALRKWIADGAPDLFGNPTRSPNRLPELKGYAGFLFWEGLYEWRCDTARNGDPQNPFFIKKGLPTELWFDIGDDSTAVRDIKINELWLSYERYDFSGAQKFAAEYVATPRVVSNFYGPGRDGVFHWRVKWNNGVPLNGDRLIYMRYRFSDGHNPPTEVPGSAAPNGVMFSYAFWLGN